MYHQPLNMSIGSTKAASSGPVGPLDEPYGGSSFSPIASHAMSVETSCSDLRGHFMQDANIQTGGSLGNKETILRGYFYTNFLHIFF